MENAESPVPVNLSARPVDRNVLKESNKIEGTTKASKDTASADQTVIISKDSHADGKAQNTSEEMPQFDGKRNNLNETRTLPQSGCPDATFVSTNAPNNQTIGMEPASPKLQGETDLNGTFEMCTQPHTGPQDATFVSAVNNNQTVVMERASSQLFDKVEAKENFVGSQLNQTQTIGDSDHDGEIRINQNEPSTPTDKRPPIDSAEKLFSSRKAPTFSEMFASTSPTITESINKPCDASFVVDKNSVTSDKCSNKESVSKTVTLSGRKEKIPEKFESNGDTTFDFKAPTPPTAGQSNKQKENVDNFMVLNSNDFDFLQSRGANSVDPENDPRSSLLLRFDPLANRHSLLTKPSLPIIENTGSTNTSTDSSNHSTNEPRANGFLVSVADAMESDSNSCLNNVRIEKNGDKVISVDELLLTNKKIDISSTDENIRKKMEEYEATQEILLKRITEKDKGITKSSNVLELYEKAISEALAAKEKLSQNYDKGHEELKSDRDVNFQHLLSLESTFADLHMKFERNVQYTEQLQEKVTGLADDKSKSGDLLKQLEFRYDRMKTHTLQQFDIANTKFEQQSRTISSENTKLKAQTKREEINKNAVAEELSQKKKENEELAKICDELISDQRN